MKHVEYWKDIPGLEGVYAVSNYGRVWSYPYEDAAGVHRKGFFISQCHRHPNKNGKQSEYWDVNLRRNKNGSRKKQGLSQYVPDVHVLVAKTFSVKWTELATKAKQFHEEQHIHVMHIDYNKWNNFAGNLQIGTHLENGNDNDTRFNNYPYTIQDKIDSVCCKINADKGKCFMGAMFSFKQFPKDAAIAAALLNSWRLCNVVGAPLYVQYAVRQEFFKRGGPALITPEIESIIDENIEKHRRRIKESGGLANLQIHTRRDNLLKARIVESYKTGLPVGVSWCTDRSKWVIRAPKDIFKQTHHVAIFKDFEPAAVCAATIFRRYRQCDNDKIRSMLLKSYDDLANYKLTADDQMKVDAAIARFEERNADIIKNIDVQSDA